MSFKDKKTNDYVCGGVWCRKGSQKFLMPDIVWDRLDFVATKKAIISLTARWPQARAKWIEDSANGPAIIAELGTEISGLSCVSVWAGGPRNLMKTSSSQMQNRTGSERRD